MGCLAATAYVWAGDPWVSKEVFSSRVIGVPSQVVAITWMGLSASLDGILTITLIRCLWRSRSPSMDRTNDLVRQLITLTLETVLLTHICGAVMCVLFLSQPAQHRTKTTAFWICLEIITELYSLSVVFTINARSSARRTFHGAPTPVAPPPTPALPSTGGEVRAGQDGTAQFVDQRRLDFAVEGMQEFSRFSYHFPATTNRGRAVGKREDDVGVDDDELLELAVLPIKGDLESAPEKGKKESQESTSLSNVTGEDHEHEKRRKRISLWGGRR
ncbi:hypothetical protein QFC21_001588 [Naganishia friedmannii]|uniref:Uncharacterized protein n=1 Tax=Naganishia friedmannii TaxID=89922 RepID=A0ACC2W749_9TREE|nr:hypothetical protein QFC21_001588 [Naganishia friedmannii]